MDVVFSYLINVIMVMYQDDLIAYSKVEDHVEHLENIFIKAIKYGISLNPKKCYFLVTKGKLLGHILSIEGGRN